MAVFKVERNKNYTTMSNIHLRDQNLSLKAKGLLSMMLSLPEDWDYSMNGLVAISKESIRAIRSTIKELEESGYLLRNRIQKTNGQFDYEYLVFENPQFNNQFVESVATSEVPPCVQNGHTVNRHTQKAIQINTKELNTKNKDIDIDITTDSGNIQEYNAITKTLIKQEMFNDIDILMLDYYNQFFNDLMLRYEASAIASNSKYIFTYMNSHDIQDRYNYFKKALLKKIEEYEYKQFNTKDNTSPNGEIYPQTKEIITDTELKQILRSFE